MRTSDDITFMLASLRELKETVPPRTLLDEDTHQAIDAQIKVLQENLDEDKVWNEWPSGHEDTFNRDRAMLAVKWLQGDDDSNPALHWLRMIGGQEA